MSAENKALEKTEDIVDPELFKKSLFNLGKTFNNARHAYLSLNLASNSLSTVNVRLPLVNRAGNSKVHLLAGH